MRLYLDCCCLNRPFDDLRQERVRIEADAVTIILAAIERGRWQLVSSEILVSEASRNPSPLRRGVVLAALDKAIQEVSLGPEHRSWIDRLLALGMRTADAAHVACAEQAKADYFLTVDDRLLKAASRAEGILSVKVESPVTFLLTRGFGGVR